MIILINMCAFVLLVGYNILYINPKTDKAQLILRSIIHALSVMLITNLLFVFVYQVILIVNIIVLLLAVLIYSYFYTHSKLFIHSLLVNSSIYNILFVLSIFTVVKFINRAPLWGEIFLIIFLFGVILGLKRFINISMFGSKRVKIVVLVFVFFLSMDIEYLRYNMKHMDESFPVIQHDVNFKKIMEIESTISISHIWEYEHKYYIVRHYSGSNSNTQLVVYDPETDTTNVIDEGIGFYAYLFEYDGILFLEKSEGLFKVSQSLLTDTFTNGTPIISSSGLFNKSTSQNYQYANGTFEAIDVSQLPNNYELLDEAIKSGEYYKIINNEIFDSGNSLIKSIEYYSDYELFRSSANKYIYRFEFNNNEISNLRINLENHNIIYGKNNIFVSSTKDDVNNQYRMYDLSQMTITKSVFNEHTFDHLHWYLIGGFIVICFPIYKKEEIKDDIDKTIFHKS